jgi:phosphatidylinositol alpha-1,6-mannosyltransferase
VGRQVKRKGVIWFLESVMPRLDPDYIYIIAGDGPELAAIRTRIRANKWGQRVFALGRVTGNVRKILFNTADIFVMPNITVPGDMEGFGIVVVEAGSCGLPVVASNTQGIRDAVVEGKTGYLVAEGDAEQFRDMIFRMNLDRDAVRTYVNREFNWSKIYCQYQDVIIPS